MEKLFLHHPLDCNPKVPHSYAKEWLKIPELCTPYSICSAHVAHPAMSQLAHDLHSTYSLSALDQGKPYADQGLPKVNYHIQMFSTGVLYNF